MFKKFSIVLLVLLMWVSIGYGGNYYGDDFVAKEFGNKGNSSVHDMSIVTPPPHVQSNKSCAGPFDYEILNREPNMVLNEFFENGKTFCKVHADDGIAYFEMVLLEQVIVLWTAEEMRDRIHHKDPVKNRKLQQFLSGEVAKQKMILNLMDGQFRQIEINYRPGRYQLWVNTVLKYKQLWKTNKNARHFVNTSIRDINDSIRNK